MTTTTTCPRCGGPGVFGFLFDSIYCQNDCDRHPAVTASSADTCKIDADGTKRWFNADGKFYRDGGLPAVEYADGSKKWLVDDKLHREGGLPAVEWANGKKEWWVDDKLHREGGLPAIEHADGSKEWWIDDKLHRDGGLPAIELASGTKEWWVNGTFIRKSP